MNVVNIWSNSVNCNRMILCWGVFISLILGCNKTLSSPLSLPEWAKEGSIQYATIDNLKIRYLRLGRGEPLVLVHTIRTQLDYFQKIIPELSKHYQVYALDLPGHGYSEITEQAHTKQLFVETVSGLMDHLDLKGVTLVGESIGGSIALGIAANRNARIKRVVSLNPADYVNSNGLDRSSTVGKVFFTAIEWPLIGWVVARAEDRNGLKKVLEGGFNEASNLPAVLLTEFSTVGEREGYPRAFRSIFLNWDSWVEGRKRYSNISVPVTLVYAEDDWSLPEERMSNKAMIKGATLVTIAGSGHFSSLEKPEKVTEIILSDNSLK